jgi:hypothetical protein
VLLLAEERDALRNGWRRSKPAAASTTRNGKRRVIATASLHGSHTRLALQQALFFDILQTTSDYMTLTALTTARAIQRKVHWPYKVTVFVDGLRRHEVPLFSKGLRRLQIQTRKVRGVRRDENNAFIRLADALCGLVRDAEEQQTWARAMLTVLQQRGLVTRL